ncbi:MAG: hypothetical protein IJJ47_01800 [Methanosphaera sp.]|nr:hypothetical protein [Methanosphaera sp.]
MNNIDIKNIIRGKTIPLTILMILACSLLSADMTVIIPSLFFIGIIMGIMKNAPMNETVLTSIISFIIGSILAFIVSLITIYYTEGGLFAIALIQYSSIYIIYYVFIGVIGSMLGFHIKNELKSSRG